MKFSELLKSKEFSLPGNYFWSNFEKVANELNFKGNLECEFDYVDENSFKIKFNNSWSIIIWGDGKYSMFFTNPKNMSVNIGIHDCEYENLLYFIEEKKLRKEKQCDYKDAELYVIDFN